jgi:hypothetical protein
MLGGTISVESKLGKGTLFTVDLPIEGPPSQHASVRANDAADSTPWAA